MYNQDSVEKVSPIDESKIYEAFYAFDHNHDGYLEVSDLRKVIEMMGAEFTEEDIYHMISEADEKNTAQINLKEFTKIILHYKNQDQVCDDSDTIDAYVAMGGQADKSGSIDAQKLIQTIKYQFEMTIDIEKLIKEVDTDGSGEIEYDEFKALLQDDAA